MAVAARKLLVIDALIVVALPLSASRRRSNRRRAPGDMRADGRPALTRFSPIHP